MRVCCVALSKLTREAHLMLLAVHHVAIICSDYEASKQFYINKLGLAVLKQVA